MPQAAILEPWILPSADGFINDPADQHQRPEGNPGDDVEHFQDSFDDSMWEDVDLPHDWAIQVPSGLWVDGERMSLIERDSFFFGQSPPIYPSPQSNGVGSWQSAFIKAQALVAQMTLEEKVNLTAGISTQNGCVGRIPGVERLSFPGFCMGDAGNGIRATDYVSSFPSGIHVGASWNKKLAYNRAAAMANEFKKKGVHVLLGPVVGPMGRVVSGGRNWESFSVDPYLAGQLVTETVIGIQDQNVIASTKHFIANEQEGNRKPWAETQSISSNIDDKTMHELYLCKLLNGLLKTELGFQGFMVSDWDAQHAGLATALAGLDMAMPSGGLFWGNRLVEAVKNGSLPEERVTDMAIRIVAPWYQMNQNSAFPPLGIGMPASITLPHEVVDARDPNARAVLLEGAIEGTVLVKNTKNTLPLQTPKMISIYGYSARSTDLFEITSDDYGYVPWTSGVEAVSFDEMVGSFVTGNFVGEHSVIARNGTIFTGGGSGATTPAVFLSPFEALKARAYQDGTAIFHDLVGSNPVVNPVNDMCIVFGNAWATETLDRPAIRDDYTDDLILKVADQCAKTIVVLHNAGVRLVDSFIDHENVTAVLFAHLPGQQSGPGIVSILYGESNPSGKLPYTVAKTEADYSSLLLPDVAEGAYVNFPQSEFEEGVYIDYRRFNAYNITPRFEFGFGLSYTTFNITELVVNRNPHVNASEWSRGDSVEGGRADLWDLIATVEIEVRNTGAAAGAEVPQLYVSIPGAPKKQLRGFEKVFLNPGESTTVQFPLRRRDLSAWDVVAQNWHLQKCTYQLFAGTSSEALPLSGKLTV